MDSKTPILLFVESDILVRHALAEYLRECGFVVLEAASGGEAIAVLSDEFDVSVVLSDLTTPGAGFELRKWIWDRKLAIEVVLAGSVEKTAEKAGSLCNEGPALAKPYQHHLVLDQIKQAIARRNNSID